MFEQNWFHDWFHDAFHDQLNLAALPKRSEMLITSLEALSHDPLSPTERRHDFRFKIFQASGIFAKEILRAKHDTCRGKTPKEVPKLTRHQRSPMVRSGPLKHNVESMHMMPAVSIKCQTDSYFKDALDFPAKQ